MSYVKVTTGYLIALKRQAFFGSGESTCVEGKSIPNYFVKVSTICRISLMSCFTDCMNYIQLSRILTLFVILWVSVILTTSECFYFFHSVLTTDFYNFVSKNYKFPKCAIKYVEIRCCMINHFKEKFFVLLVKICFIDRIWKASRGDSLCELCHSHAMPVKHLLTDYANLADSRLKCLDGSDPSTMKQIIGSNKVNSNIIQFLKESNIFL